MGICCRWFLCFKHYLSCWFACSRWFKPWPINVSPSLEVTNIAIERVIESFNHPQKGHDRRNARLVFLSIPMYPLSLSVITRKRKAQKRDKLQKRQCDPSLVSGFPFGWVFTKKNPWGFVFFFETALMGCCFDVSPCCCPSLLPAHGLNAVRSRACFSEGLTVTATTCRFSSVLLRKRLGSAC